jgi:hypothetical protein
MVPTAFDGENVILDKPSSMSADDCSTISVLRTETDSGMPVTISCWKLTRDELEEVNRTGRVWLTICGVLVPPVMLATKRPFELPSNDETPKAE